MTTRRKPIPDGVVTHGGLTSADFQWYGDEWGIPATSEQSRSYALGMLRHSRDAQADATIFYDDHEVEALANTAGVQVMYVHVELGHACTVEYRTAG